jgi:hypothetical protein
MQNKPNLPPLVELVFIRGFDKNKANSGFSLEQNVSVRRYIGDNRLF